MNAPISQKTTLHKFEDGDETVTVRLIETVNGEYAAFDAESINSPMGWGLSSIGAIADLFEKMPRAASEREERDRMANKFDHERDYRKHDVSI